MNTDKIFELLSQTWHASIALFNGPQFYYQIGLFLTALLIAHGISKIFSNNISLLQALPVDGNLLHLRTNVYKAGRLIRPLFLLISCAITINIAQEYALQTWLLRICTSLTIIFIVYQIIQNFVEKPFFKKLAIWFIMPMAILYVFDLLDTVTSRLELISIHIGNIEISAYGIARVLIFGFILFWLGRISNNAGQQIIRSQEDLEQGTREVFAKLFQVLLFFVVFILLMQIMGINLTALAVFGGALGVGLGFGLQSIASNFISGIILLLDRSLGVGDYIEMEDGRSGTVTKLNMRSTVVETFDGKVIMVPNEQFITSSFINWTHNNKKQRYSLEFQVSYKTDIHFLLDIVRKTVASHPQVLSGEDVPVAERPDAEIQGFGESGVNILVEFWMDDIDDGPNKVGADLLLMIWDTLHQHNIEIPFPQREITVINK